MKVCPDTATMKAEIGKFISVGMPVRQAKQIMEVNGFQCHDYDDLSDPPSLLRCSAIYHPWSGLLNHPVEFFFCADEILVLLEYQSGTITKVTVDCHYVGP